MRTMTHADNRWGISNPGPDTLFVWLEPWAEEFEVQTRSTILLKPAAAHHEDVIGEIEWTEDHLVVWASARTIEVFIDGELRDTASAIIAIPDGLTKKMLGIAFAGQPAARLGGTPNNAIQQASWCQRVRRRLKL